MKDSCVVFAESLIDFTAALGKFSEDYVQACQQVWSDAQACQQEAQVKLVRLGHCVDNIEDRLRAAEAELESAMSQPTDEEGNSQVDRNLVESLRREIAYLNQILPKAKANYERGWSLIGAVNDASNSLITTALGAKNEVARISDSSIPIICRAADLIMEYRR